MDGLRGIAALAVVLVHFFQVFLLQAFFGFGFWSFLQPLGNLAVCVFFTLSGYVLTNKFFQDKDTNSIQLAAIGRYFRLVPVVLASLLLAYLFFSVSLNQVLPLSKVTGVPMGELTYSVLTLPVVIWSGLYGVFVKGDTYLNPALWTIQTELIGSFLVYGLALLLYRFPKRWLVYLALIPALYGSYYLAFLLGLMLSDFFTVYPQKYNYPILLAFLIAAALTLGFLSVPAPELNVYNHVLAAGLLLFVTLNSAWIQKQLSGPVSAFLGRVSYSLYAVHWPLILSFSALFFLSIHSLLPVYISIPLTFLISLPVFLITAELFTQFIDQPGINLSKLITRWLVT